MKQQDQIPGYKIKMFGEFCISDDNIGLDEDQMHSKMLTKLFSYIYCHKKKEITVSELVEALWDEDSVNPAGALKNLVYRLRNNLKQLWPYQDFILAHRGSYIWNEEINAISDAELLEEKYHQGQNSEDPFERANYFIEGIELYTGPFLPKLGSEQWVIPLSAHYHSLYLSLVKETAALLFELEDYPQMERISNLALQQDQLNEELHFYYVQALLNQNKIKLAEIHYRKAVDLLYDNLGIPPSEELKNLYQEFLKETRKQQDNLSIIQEELHVEKHHGAFLCEYGVFRKTYHLERARVQRFGISTFLSLITVEPAWEIKTDTPAYLNLIKVGMDYLEEVLLKDLRSGDVVSRYSVCQYVIMLPSCQYETAKMVMDRIDRAFRLRYKKRPRTFLRFDLDEMFLTSKG